jgi:hypothetical protein
MHTKLIFHTNKTVKQTLVKIKLKTEIKNYIELKHSKILKC